MKFEVEQEKCILPAIFSHWLKKLASFLKILVFLIPSQYIGVFPLLNCMISQPSSRSHGSASQASLALLNLGESYHEC
jgi:hypothetical protein